MKQLFKVMIVPFLVMFLSAGGAMADNITIWDGIDSYTGLEVDSEKGEAESGMQQNKEWWLESFELDGSILSTTGFFNFAGGYGGQTAGDIFVAVDTAPQYGPSADNTVPNFGYDFVFDIDWANGRYSVYELNDTTDQSKYVLPNVGSNQVRSSPFNFIPGDLEAEYSNLTFSIADDNATLPLYTASGFDLGFLGADVEIWTHLTLSCGNDSMMGHGTTSVPEPATLLLLGTGLFGLGILSRKRFKK